MCQNKEHKFPRRGYEQRLTSSKGTREITTCNDCLATRIRFMIDQIDGLIKEKIVVVEPTEDEQ
jgi:hypothetical protein